MLDFTEYTKMLIGLIAIINPIGAIPIFMSLTSHMPVLEREQVAKTAPIAVCLILLIAMVLGEMILGFFGITISSFRVAGGILILFMAMAMMNGKTSLAKQTPEEAEESEHKDSITVVPLAIPLLAGPGAISTIILYAHKGDGIAHLLVISVIIFILSAILFACFKSVRYIGKYLSNTGVNVFTRIMGLILAAVAIEFLANGLKGLFPALA